MPDADATPVESEPRSGVRIPASAVSPAHRRIDDTGERMVPWMDNLQVVYEHVHRYWMAAKLVTGRRVLDLACGEGYGAALMANLAAEVLGVDIDEESVLHAKAAYPLDNLDFVVGSIEDEHLLAGRSATFDVITCFEAIEHVANHDAVLENVARLLDRNGVFVVSTPDTDVYSGAHGQDNPFHVHELSVDDFRSLLKGSFKNVRLYGQRASVGSVIASLDATGGGSEVVTLSGTGEADPRWLVSPGFIPEYVVALASNGPLPDLGGLSTLSDADFGLVRQAHRDLERARAATHEQMALVAELRRQVGELTRRHGVPGPAVGPQEDPNAGRLQDLENSLAAKAQYRYRRAVDRLLPPGSPGRSAYTRGIRVVRRALGVQEPALLIELATSAQPLLSIVIPVHGNWNHTEACLKALARDRISVSFEAIVVDDCSPDDTRSNLALTRGVRVVALDQNVGFVRACNAGIRATIGRFVLLLNNDTKPAIGAIDALIDAMFDDPRVGVVGAKLIDPDGVLQEAGAIVWADGYGWNVGRGGDPDAPEVNFPREVDYCSGAALLVRREVLEHVGGGLDERFAPAYYEDTDLCFAARRLGYRVLYQPRATVVHHEGVSHGRDPGSGVKRYQEVNRRKFVEKWGAELGTQLPNDEKNVPLARQRPRAGRVVVIDYIMPTYDQDAGALRMYRLLRLFRELDYGVTFVPASRELTQPYTAGVLDLGVEVLSESIDLGDRLAALAPDLDAVVVSRWHTAARLYDLVRASAPMVPFVFDTVDLHFRRHEVEAADSGDPKDWEEAIRVREEELAIAGRADLTLVVSTEELDLLRDLAPEASVELLPIVHDAEPTVTAFDARAGLLFIANFQHPPNVDAVLWFTSEVLPLVRRREPDVVLHVVGSRMVPEVRALESDTVRIEGWLHDLRPQYESRRVVVAPMRYGAGMKGKVTEALAHGVPVVTTTVGVDGMLPDVQALASVADEPDAMAEAVLEAYRDGKAWERLHTTAPWIVAEHYGATAVRERLKQILGTLQRAPRA